MTDRISRGQFFMLRYETEFTPCTGITAVTRQERRHFKGGVIVAPWCGRMNPEGLRDTGWKLDVAGNQCRVLASADEFAPVLLLDVPGRFRGVEDPYDVPIEELRTDALWFGLAADALLAQVASPGQFVWGADWETVPALSLVRHRHLVSLTLHNTFDECLQTEAELFGDVYRPFWERPRTALGIGVEIADVLTTVNRGFARGIRTELLQTAVMVRHIPQERLRRVVGINNAGFRTLGPELVKLRAALAGSAAKGAARLFAHKRRAASELAGLLGVGVEGKVIVVSMGRRVAQKQHDVLVESVRQILAEDPAFPILVVFATAHGDPERLERMRTLPAANAVCLGRLPEETFKNLMAAADYNCMPSLFEPHGGAFDGTVVPIARAVDGLAEQICPFEPSPEVAELTAEWRRPGEAPSGFLFREPCWSDPSTVDDLRALLETTPSPDNRVFREMRDSLTAVLKRAVRVRLEQPQVYAALVRAALEKQEGLSWEVNLGGMLALMEQARIGGRVSARAGL
jgi:glycosyltransferase involved in cell wall biosynthesis